MVHKWELLGGAVCGLPPPLVVCYSAFGRGRQQHFCIFISIDISSKYTDALLKEQSTCLLWLNEMLYKLSFGPSTKMPLFGAQKCSFGPQINVMEASDFWRHRYISKRSFSTWLLSLTCGEIYMCKPISCINLSVHQTHQTNINPVERSHFNHLTIWKLDVSQMGWRGTNLTLSSKFLIRLSGKFALNLGWAG